MTTKIARNQIEGNYATVSAMVASTLLSGQTATTVGYYDGWAATLEPAGGATYTVATLAEVRSVKSDGAWVPDEWTDHTLANGNVAMIDDTNGITTKQAGAKVDGASGTDDTLPIQAAVNRLCRVTASSGTSKTTAQITIPSEGSLVGEGRRGGVGSSTIHAVHTGNSILNLSGDGTTNIHLSGLQLTSDATTYPKTGLLLGRTSAASAGHHYIEFIKIQGYFSVACIYSIASEVNTWNDIYVWNLSTNGAKYCFYTSNSDDLGVAGLTTSTNLVQTLTSMYMINASQDPDAACIYMESGESMAGWHWFSPYLIPYAGSYVHINNVTDSQALGDYGFFGLAGERLSGGAPMYGMRITNNSGLGNWNLHGLNITGNRFDLTVLNTTTGSDNASTAAAFMTNTAASYTVDEFVGMVIENETDGSYAVITSNAATTISGTLRGGTNNSWDSGDTFTIYDRYSIFIDSNVTLTQPNVVLQQAEALNMGLYPQDKYPRNKIKGGVFSVGREGLWTTATLLNSWINNFGSPAVQASYSMDATGNVGVRGLVSAGSGTIMTLPKNLRPSSDMYFSTSGNSAYARLKVTASSGNVTLDAGAGPQVDLGAINYRV